MTKTESLRKALDRDKANMETVLFQEKLRIAIKNLLYGRYTLFQDVEGGVTVDCEAFRLVKVYYNEMKEVHHHEN